MPMDLEDKKRRQTLKVILVEMFMTVAVVVTVVILVLVASGYWINSDFKIQRSGLLKIDSEPTGATVMIDGEEYPKTNFSKVISSEEHNVVLTKEGYDSWSKAIKVTEGLLYQLRYPRLFLQERVKEHVLDFENISFASVTPDRRMMFVIEKDSTWELVNLSDEKMSKKTIEPLIVTKEKPFIVSKVEWSRNGRKMLLQGTLNNKNSWIYVDLDDNKNNFNITDKYAVDFEKVSFLNNSNELLAYSNKDVFKIDLTNKTLSEPLIKNTSDYFAFLNDGIVFVAEKDGKNMINILRGRENINLINLDEPARIAVTPFYNDKYLIVFTAKEITIYKGERLEPVFREFADINLDNLRIMDGEGYVVARDGNKINAIDMEAMQLSVWDAEVDRFGWLDNFLIYAVSDGALKVYDFDGQNGRELSKNVSSDFPVTITDNKWLYYFSENALMREWLIRK